MNYIESGNAQIQHANDAYRELIRSGVITDPDILNIAQERISSEQQYAIESMSGQFDTEFKLATEISKEDLDRQSEIHEEIDRLKSVNEQLEFLSLYYPDANDEILNDNTINLSSLRAELAKLSLREVSIEDYPHLYFPWTIPANKTIIAADTEEKYTQLFDFFGSSDQNETENPDKVDSAFEYIFPYDKKCPQKEGAKLIDRSILSRCSGKLQST